MLFFRILFTIFFSTENKMGAMKSTSMVASPIKLNHN